MNYRLGKGSPTTIAFFISSHGFGHAARAAAVMDALGRRMDNPRFEIFTTVPRWFFEDSVGAPIEYHETFTDIGFAQQGPFRENINKTLEILDSRLPFDPQLVKKLADRLINTNSRMVLCDIAAIGIPAAKHADIPSVLIENFTWDWIYEAYVCENRRFIPHVQYLAAIREMADFHFQTIPVVKPDPDCDLTVNPVARSPRNFRDETRKRLGILPGRGCVLLTTGGIAGRFDFLDRLSKVDDTLFVVPGGADVAERRGNLLLLPHRSRFYHPDLILAADVVIGKVGYSTLAEVYHAGVPFGYIPRKRFPESPALVEFIQKEMSGMQIPQEDFLSGAWIDRLSSLCSLPNSVPNRKNGAGQLALRIKSLLTDMG